MADEKIVNETNGFDETVKKFEQNVLDLLPDAENGDKEAERLLNELTGEMIVCCSSEVVLRLAEFYCLSIETADKAKQICDWMLDHDRWQLIDVKNLLGLSCALPVASKSLDDWSNPTVVQGRALIRTCAEDGYALAQYWMGYMAEDNHDMPTLGVSDGRPRALEWYRKAASQGISIARKRLAEVSEQLECDRKRFGKCPYCGGGFKGLFKKLCRKCGKPKDY